MHRTKVEILNQDVDPDGKTPSYYRILVDRKHFKYVTIDPKIYEVKDLCFPPALVEKLPPFPEGDWNCGRISRTVQDPAPFFAQISKARLPAIEPLWHAGSYDYLSLDIRERLKANVYLVSSPQSGKRMVAKFARFDWEIDYYISEARAYSWIDGHSIGPEFLGYLKEEGRAIGFLIEHVQGRHATIQDIPACEAVLTRLHHLGILHGDLNKHNFLISERGATLIDFETAKRSDNKEAMEKEIQQLKEHLLDESGTGGVTLES